MHFGFVQTYQSIQVNKKQGQGKCNPQGNQAEFTGLGIFQRSCREGSYLDGSTHVPEHQLLTQSESPR